MANVRDFSGKVVIVAGSSAGIGATTAVSFSKSGVQIVITGRNAKNLSEVAQQCKKVSPKGLEALEVVADVTKTDDCKQLIDSTINKFGRLDILVDNAGAAFLGLIKDSLILDVYDRTMNLNVRSVVYLTHLSVEHLEKKPKGVIINISSVSGLKPCPTVSIYCVSKIVLDMFTKCLALELGPKGIRVNVVNPGLIRTGFREAAGLPKEVDEQLYKNQRETSPLRRVGESEDISSAILYLSPDESSFVTGINLAADEGGLWA